MAPDHPPAGPLPGLNRWQTATASTHVFASILAGLIGGALATATSGWALGALVAWLAAGVTFLSWIWASIWRLDGADTARLAGREDSSRTVRDLVLLTAAGGSLVTVALVIFPARHSGTPLVALGVASVIVSWSVVHTVFALAYGHLYYAAPAGGLDFKQDSQPTFRDFAYVAFTVGMTFQVSDTDVQKSSIRVAVLRHAILSFFLGAIIIAVTINVVAGLSR